MGAELFSKLLTVIFFAFLARNLTSNDIGIYVTVLTFMSIGLFFADPGLSQTLIRNISRDRCKGVRELGDSLTLSTGASLATWGGMVILAYAFDYPKTLVFMLTFVGISLTFNAWAQIASAFIKAQHRMEIVALGNSVSLAIFSLLGIFLLLMGFGLSELTGLLIFQALFNFIFFRRAAIRLGLPFPCSRWNLRETANFMKEALPIALLVGSAIAINNIDIMMLSKIKGMSDTADYGLAVKFIDNLSLLSGSVLTALFPFFSSKWENSRPEIIKAFTYAWKFFLVTGMISVAIISVLSRQVITLVYGGHFSGSSDALVILVWSFFFYMVGAPLGILILMEKERLLGFVPYALGVVLLNVFLNLFLIPTYSYIGASISTVICSVMLYFFKVRFLKDVIQLKKTFYKIAFKPLVASVAMGMVFLLAKNMRLVISLTLGGCSFLLMLWMLGEFRGEEYSGFSFRQFLQKLK